jgi:hypothetical protein
MDDDFIVAAYVVIDKVMAALGHRDDVRAKVSDAEVLTVAVVAAKYFQNHHARALQVMLRLRYLSGTLSASRFNRRLHALGDWLGLALETLGAVFACARSSSSTACRCRSAGVPARGAAGRCAA